MIRSVVALVVVVLTHVSGCGWLQSAETRVARAEEYVAEGKERGAAIELKKALDSEPQNITARLMLAEVSLRLGDPRSAENEINKALEHGARLDQVASLRARVQLAKGEYQQLLTSLDTGTLKLPTPDVATFRGLALLGLQQTKEAIAAFKTALGDAPEHSRARTALAEAYVNEGRVDLALQELDRALESNDSDALAWLLKGSLDLRRGESQAAVAALLEAKTNSGGQLDASQLLVLFATLMEAQLALGELEEAGKTHAMIAARSPESPLTRLLAARLAMSKQQYSTAIAELQKALASAPQLPQAHLLLGAALLANGNLNQAEAQLAELVRQDPTNAEARKLLAQVNLRLNRSERAAQVLAPMQTPDTADAEVDALLGLVKLQDGNDDAAIELLRRSLAARPENDELKVDLALAYLRSGKNNEALELLESLSEGSLNERGEILRIAALAAAKGFGAAAAEMERAVANDPKNVRVLNVAGSLFAQQGEYDRARSYLAAALTLEPQNARTLMNRARVELAAGDYSAARDALDRLVQAHPSNNFGRLALAQMALRRGDEKEAVVKLEEARSADPKDINARMLLAAIYMQQNKSREAVDLIREASAVSSDKAGVSAAAGEMFMRNGRLDEAAGSFRLAMKLDPAEPRHAVNLARAQLAIGDNASARMSVLKALDLDPGLLSAHAALTMMDLRDGRREEAEARIEGLRRSHPSEPGVAILEGDIAMALKDYARAAKAYAAATKSKPSAQLAIRHSHALQLGKLPQPAAPLHDWLENDEDDVQVRVALAEALAAQGDRRAAMTHYERAAQLAPNSATVLNNLAWMYFEARDSRAEPTAKRAYELAPKVSEIADTYGWILARGGKAEMALPILEQAVSQGSARAEIRYHYAVVLNEVGKADRAREELQELLQSTQSFAEMQSARRLLAELSR